MELENRADELQILVNEKETQLETYRKKEADLKSAVKETAAWLGISGQESPRDMMIKLAGKLPALFSGKADGLVRIWEVFKNELTF